MKKSNRAIRAVSALALTSIVVGCGEADNSPSPPPVAAPAPVPAPTPTPTPPPTSPQSPNVLILMVDDLRPALGVYGDQTAKSPNIDEFAKTGMVFDNAFVSISLCGPSRASLLTGLRPDTTSITGNSDLVADIEGLVTLPDQFRKAGYKTESLGKVYHSSWDDANGFTYRFRGQDNKHELAIEQVEDETILQDWIVKEKAKERLAIHEETGSPFMMAVGFRRPHLPFAVPKTDWDQFTAQSLVQPIRPNGQDGQIPWAFLTNEIYGYADFAPFKPVDNYAVPSYPQAAKEDLVRGYMASVSFVDRMIGEVIDYLDASGLAENTIVVLWGDHGYKLGDYGHFGKTSNADIDIKIPLIIRVPEKTRAGTRTAAIVETVDIYPTLADLAGLGIQQSLEGQSFDLVLEKPGSIWKTAAFSEYDRKHASGAYEGSTVRTSKFRYTAWLRHGKIAAQELYNLVDDPREERNIAWNPQFAQDMTRLEEIRKRGWKQVRSEVRNRYGLN